MGTRLDWKKMVVEWRINPWCLKVRLIGNGVKVGGRG